jgi:adenylate cyclase
LTAAVGAVLLGVGYTALAWWVFVKTLVLWPIVLPVSGALLLHYVCATTYRVVFEQREQRRIRGIFSKIVSPDVVNELLKAERLALGGAQRRVTVFFADVRGFTEMTDQAQAMAEEYVRQRGFTGSQAQEHVDAQAREMLNTVNLYLGTIADVIMQHNGTLDKYIGDCVMAFWGAPIANDRHALACVQAAIAAQRAIHQLNLSRSQENQRREAENQRLSAEGKETLPMLGCLLLGTGINTGVVTVGLMGSDAHVLNYTVFGREVNLASRLEGVSGRGRIVIGEGTYADLKRDDSELAAKCIPQPPVVVKGFRDPINIYIVPWRDGDSPSGDKSLLEGATGQTVFFERH